MYRDLSHIHKKKIPWKENKVLRAINDLKKRKKDDDRGNISQLKIPGKTFDEQANNLLSRATDTKPHFDGLLNKTWNDVDKRFNLKWDNKTIVHDSKKVPLKKKSVLIEKTRNKNNWFMEKILDCLRWSLIFHNNDSLKEWLNVIKKEGIIVREKNRLGNILQNDILLNVSHPNGFISEVQLHNKEIFNAKEKWIKITKDIFDLRNYWNDDDYKKLDKLHDNHWFSKAPAKTTLPKQGDIVKTHDLYKIRRAIDNLIKKEKNMRIVYSSLNKKLTKMESEINKCCIKNYKKRTWKII